MNEGEKQWQLAKNYDYFLFTTRRLEFREEMATQWKWETIVFCDLETDNSHMPKYPQRGSWNVWYFSWFS